MRSPIRWGEAFLRLLSVVEGTADPSTARRDRSASLRTTKGGAEFPLGIGCRDPRSQKRHLVQPSVVVDAALAEMPPVNFL
jgi:hypothetical protein